MITNAVKFLVLATAIICTPALAASTVYKGTWSSGVTASFSVKSDDVITYCFNDVPCSDYRFEGTVDLIQVTFPGDGQFLGAFMELTKKANGHYSAEYYYGPEANQRLGTNHEATFKVR